MKKTMQFSKYIVSLLLLAACCMQGCKQQAAPDGSGKALRGTPVLRDTVPEYDETTKSYSLCVVADSCADAELAYYLIDGDSVLQQNSDGRFSGIAPFDEGYDVRVTVQWSDTTVECIRHYLGFMERVVKVEKLLEKDLADLINARDKSLSRGSNEHLAQGVKLVVENSRSQPALLGDVMMLLSTGVWKRVVVDKLDYDENNLITTITLHPEGEVVPSSDDEDEDEDEDY